MTVIEHSAEHYPTTVSKSNQPDAQERTIKSLLVRPVPLERLSLDRFSDGSVGSNRAPNGPTIAANNDIEAINCWLLEFEISPRTQRNYRAAAERVCCWALIERGKAFSSLTLQDLDLYRCFLGSPDPTSRWCGKHTDRQHNDWRPFRGPLQASSVIQEMQRLNALFNYLVDTSYLSTNPLGSVRLKHKKISRSINTDIKCERFLSQEAWTWVLSYIESMPKESSAGLRKYERLRYLFHFLYLLAPRAAEIIENKMGSFTCSEGRWWWKVIGKGDKQGNVPVTSEMLAALNRYRISIGLSAYPSAGETTPLLLNVSGERGIQASQLYRLVTKTLNAAATYILEQDTNALDNPARATAIESLRNASTHWIRHTAATHSDRAGVEFKNLNKILRHSKLETTNIYRHSEADELHDNWSRHHKLQPQRTNDLLAWQNVFNAGKMATLAHISLELSLLVLITSSLGTASIKELEKVGFKMPHEIPEKWIRCNNDSISLTDYARDFCSLFSRESE